MTLYGVGLGPGAPDLLTVRGKRVLERVDVVYSPGRLSRSVALEYVPESKLSDLDFPMTRPRETSSSVEGGSGRRYADSRGRRCRVRHTR